jgi:hypothetical protein
VAARRCSGRILIGQSVRQAGQEAEGDVLHPAELTGGPFGSTCSWIRARLPQNMITVVVLVERGWRDRWAFAELETPNPTRDEEDPTMLDPLLLSPGMQRAPAQVRQTDALSAAEGSESATSIEVRLKSSLPRIQGRRRLAREPRAVVFSSGVLIPPPPVRTSHGCFARVLCRIGPTCGIIVAAPETWVFSPARFCSVRLTLSPFPSDA